MTSLQNDLAAIAKLQSAGSLDDALLALEILIAASPGSLVLKIRRGEVLRKLHRLGESRDCLLQTLDENTSSVDAMYQLALTFQSLGESTRSLTLYESVLEHRPDHLGAHIARIEAQLGLGDHVAALAAADAAIGVLPDNIALKIKRGVILRQMQRHGESYAYFEGLLSKTTADTNAGEDIRKVQLELVRSAMAAGELIRAKQIALQLTRADSDKFVAFQTLVQAEIKAWNPVRALKLVDSGRVRWPDSEWLERMGVILLIRMRRLTEADTRLARMRKPQVDLRFTVDLELRRYNKIRAEIAHREANHKVPHLTIKKDRARLLHSEGNVKQANQLKGEIHLEDPSDIATTVAVLNNLLNRRDLEAAETFLNGLSSAQRKAEEVRLSEALYLVHKGEAEKALQIITEEFELSPPGFGCISALARQAVAEGLGTPGAETALHLAEKLISQSEGRFPDFTLDVLRLQLSVIIGNWPKAARLATKIYAMHPGDLRILAIKARADYEMGRLDDALSATEEVLVGTPCDTAAIELRKALFLATGDVEGYLGFSIKQVENGNTNLSERLLRELSIAGRGAKLEELVTRYLSDAPHENAQIDVFRRYFFDRGKPDRPVDVLPIKPRAFSDEDLRGLLYETPDMAPSGMALFPTQYFAQELLCAPDDDAEKWRAKARRATYVYSAITTRPLLKSVPPAFVHSPEVTGLRAKLARKEPTLLVASHFGTNISVCIRKFFDNVTYLVGMNDRTLDLDVPILRASGLERRIAADVVKVLRAGNSVFSAPDFPIRYYHPHGMQTTAIGTMFGVRCELLDLVPKISKALKVPSYWILPRWRDGAICVDVARLPDPEDGEAPEDWGARWAQAYLDHVAEVMQSDPKNLQLNAMMLFDLMFRRAGGHEGRRTA